MAVSPWRRALVGKFGLRRLASGVVIGVGVSFATQPFLRLPFRVASGWIAGVALYLLLTGLVNGPAGPAEAPHYAGAEGPRRLIILLLVIAAAFVSLLALGFGFV